MHWDFRGGTIVDLAGLSTKAFQRLWNRNHPSDTIAEDGSYGGQTETRLKKSPAAGFAQGGEGGLGAMERAAQADRHLIVPILVGDILQRNAPAGEAAGGVVDHRIEPAELRQRSGDGRFDFGAIGNIAAAGDGVAARTSDFLGNLFGGIEIARGHDHACAGNGLSSGRRGRGWVAGIGPTRQRGAADRISFQAAPRIPDPDPAGDRLRARHQMGDGGQAGPDLHTVLLGQVTVARKDAAEEVVVGPGQGVDVSTGDAGKTVRSMSSSAKPAPPIGVKKWAPDRVKALLARFGQ